MSVTALALKARDRAEGECGEFGDFLMGDFIAVAEADVDVVDVV